MGKSAPPAPDYKAAAEATAAGNLANTKAQTVANRPNIVTPFGTQTWQQSATPGSFDQAGYDAALAKYNATGAPGGESSGTISGQWGETADGSTRGTGPTGTAPNRADFTTPAGDTNWTQTTTLTPEMQAALDSQQRIGQGRSDAAEGLLGQATSAFQNPIDYSKLPQGAQSVQAGALSAPVNPTAMRNQDLGTPGELFSMGGTPGSVTGSASSSMGIQGDMSRTAGDWRQQGQNAVLDFNKPIQQQRQQALESQLSNMGLTRGGEAWNNEMRRLQDQDQRDNLQSFAAGQSEAGQLFGQDLASSQFHNNAQAQDFGQSTSNARLGNDAQQQSWNQEYANTNLKNQNQQTAFAQNAANATFGNAAQQQDHQNLVQAAQRGDQQALQELQMKMSAGSFNQNIRNSALAEQQTQRAQPLNELNALLSGQQVAMPNMPSFNAANNTPGADYSGAARDQYQADLDAFNAQQAGDASMMNGLFSLGGAAMGAPSGGFMSKLFGMK